MVAVGELLLVEYDTMMWRHGGDKGTYVEGENGGGLEKGTTTAVKGSILESPMIIPFCVYNERSSSIVDTERLSIFLLTVKSLMIILFDQ